MRETWLSFNRHCPCCQKMSKIKTQIKTLDFVTATDQPMNSRIIYRANTEGFTERNKIRSFVGSNCKLLLMNQHQRYVRSSNTTKHLANLNQLLSDNGSLYVYEVIDL